MTDQIARPNAGPENDGPNKPNLSQYVHWVVTNELNRRSTVPVEMMKFKYQLEFVVNLSPDNTV